MTVNYGDPIWVSAGDVSRNFGQWQDKALAGPVIVTHHGRSRVVVISADAYTKLVAHDETPYGDVGIPDSSTTQSVVLNNTSEAFFAFDSSLHIVAVNGVFEALSGRAAIFLKGMHWKALFNAPAQAVVGDQLGRVMRTGETIDFEVDSLEPGGRHYSVRLFPYAGGVGGLIHNRSEEHDLRSRLQTAEALGKAAACLPDLSFARLNVRGVFAWADEAFAKLSGFSAEELLSFRLSDIIKPVSRHAFSDILELALKGLQPSAFSTKLLAKTGEEHPVQLGMSVAVGHGVPEGVVVAVQAKS